MKGVLLISHGKMSEGVYDALKMFFESELDSVDFLGLPLGNSPEWLKEEMLGKIKKLDTGDGVIVFADMRGGTPANVASTILLEGGNITLIAGMSLPMLMESLFLRSSGDFTVEAALEAGKDSVVCVNDLFKNRKKKD